MSAVGTPELTIRLERVESSRLAWAFAISVAVHLLVYGVYEGGRRTHLWERMHLPSWLTAPRALTQLFVKAPTPKELAKLEKERQEEEKRWEKPPLMFIDVSSAQATPEPPKKAQFYAARNSLAANPDTTVPSSIPKIDGKQREVAKTEDVPRTQMFPLRPAPPKPAVKPALTPPKPPPEPAKATKPEPVKETKPDPVAEAKLKAAMAAGNMVMGRPEEAPRKGQDKAEVPHKKRFRRLQDLAPEVLMAALAGDKMKQEGGVQRRDLISSVDAIASPFGEYDEAMIAAVQKRWYELLDEDSFAGDRTGKVTLRFHLNADGSVSEMVLKDYTVNLTLALICQSAVRDPAPFAPWPTAMRKEIGASYREVTFVFYYR